METAEERKARKAKKKQRRREIRLKIRRNPLWIIFMVLVTYILGAGILHLFYDSALNRIKEDIPAGIAFTMEFYTATIVDVFVLFLLTWLVRDNRYIWKSFLPPKKYREGEAEEPDNIAAEFYGRSRNTFGMLCKGLLLGFLTNFICILCALIHGDIKLYFESSLSEIPIFVFALLSVCLQSTSEELWCRGLLYERLHEKYPLWFAVAVNGVLFGFLHIFNPGVSPIAIAGITVTGLSYSLLRWYSGNIWIAMGIHTGWNFTQNYLFGLPNSGLVSEVSLFHLDASTGISNLIYDYAFGVEAAVPALLTDAALGIICLMLAARSGRLGELGMSRIRALEKTAETD